MRLQQLSEGRLPYQTSFAKFACVSSIEGCGFQRVHRARRPCIPISDTRDFAASRQHTLRRMSSKLMADFEMKLEAFCFAFELGSVLYSLGQGRRYGGCLVRHLLKQSLRSIQNALSRSCSSCSSFRLETACIAVLVTRRFLVRQWPAVTRSGSYLPRSRFALQGSEVIAYHGSWTKSRKDAGGANSGLHPQLMPTAPR